MLELLWIFLYLSIDRELAKNELRSPPNLSETFGAQNNSTTASAMLMISNNRLQISYEKWITQAMKMWNFESAFSEDIMTR